MKNNLDKRNWQVICRTKKIHCCFAFRCLYETRTSQKVLFTRFGLFYAQEGSEASEQRPPEESFELTLSFFFSSICYSIFSCHSHSNLKTFAGKAWGEESNLRSHKTPIYTFFSFFWKNLHLHTARFGARYLWDCCSWEVGEDRRLQVAPQVPSVPQIGRLWQG